MRYREGTDDDLVRAIAEGDPAAFSELMQRHRRWVFNLLSTITHDREQAEDLTQEVFTRVHRHAGCYRGQGQFPAWLKKIAVNLARSYLTRQKQAPLLSLSTLEVELAQDERFDPMMAFLSKGLQEEIRAAIASLPDEQRLAVIMRYFGGMSIQDIAWAMQCAEGTIKSRIFHGLRSVRAIVTGAGKRGRDRR
ncbi:MAG TPA: sigma-70 family RNA polymerase sigma factor [Chthonomonadaceae bacterium]|nr:sigma-70 family RNA polymerase sigma factor [Chthonomonadaceae bacterium]